MYVNIGKYPKNYVSSKIQSWYMERKYGQDWYDIPSPEYTVMDNIVFWVDEAVQKFYDSTINPILDKREQKVIIRVDDYDIWNADVTLARIIHPVLCALRNDLNTIGSVDDEDVPEHLRSSDDDSMEKRWHYVLDEMILAFELSKGLDDTKYSTLQEYLNEFKENEIKIKNGLRLFGKYYQSLWT